MLKKIIIPLILVASIPQLLFASSWDRIYLKDEVQQEGSKMVAKSAIYHNEFMANIYTPIDTNGLGLYYEIAQTHFTSKNEKVFLVSDITFTNNDLVLRPGVIGYIDNLLLIWDGFLGAGFLINNPTNSNQILCYLTCGARLLWFMTKYDIDIDSNLNIKNKTWKYGLSFSI